MQAIVQTGYGGPEVLQLREIERPAVLDGTVLIRVRAASLHAGDWFVLRGAPYPARFASGWPKPKPDYVVGLDVAGIVEAVGSGVTRFRPGDEVFAEGSPGAGGTGACAEYARVGEDTVVPKPANFTFEQAAAIPVSALAALHGLRDAAKVRPGQKVLVNGASGGVGTYAVQIAKVLGAEVTGVCSTGHVETVRSIGADHVVDYTAEDFTRDAARYDLVFDCVGNRTFSDMRRALALQGKILPNSGRAGMGFLMKGFALSAFTGWVARPYLSEPNREDLTYLKDLAEAGSLRPVIDSTHPLSETAQALARVGEGHAAGKVVVTV